MKAVVFTLGCKVNEVESASVMSRLEGLGFEVTDRLCPADIYVLNTCAVTREAEKKSRQLVARARKFNPQAPVYVCGCASEKNAAQFEGRGVKFICGAKDKGEVVQAIAADLGLTCAGGSYPKQCKTRAFVKVEDGCDNFCSYCIIPYLRGRVKSRAVDDIVREIAATPSREIVLTGINISAFGKDTGERLPDLLRALSFCDKRIRLGSLECNIIDDGFLAACKGLKNFAPQFHLSLQSGSDAILKAMNRHYTRGEYLQKCALVYRYFPDAAITTDIIVGFCGETESDFAQSLSIVKEAGFARIHAFAFSPREGTRAYSMPDLPAAVKAERLHALLEEGKRAEEAYITARLGSGQSVIFEDYDGQYTCGYTAGYIKVYVGGNHTGEAQVNLVGLFRDGALAEVVESHVIR